MDEEFFFPQNVRTSYRLWILGPRHLKRLGLAPVLALLFGWVLHTLPVLVAAGATSLIVAAYCALCVVPVAADEQTAWDVWREIRTHRKAQARFHHQRGVMIDANADPQPPWA